MLSLLKTILTLLVFLVQFSSSAAIKRHHGWHPPYNPWWPWSSWPTVHHTHSVATSTAASTFSLHSPSPSVSASPATITTSSDDDDDSFTLSLSIETGIPTASTSSEGDENTVTTSRFPSATTSPVRVTSTQVPVSVKTTAKPQTTVASPSSTRSSTSTATQATSPPSGDFWKPAAGVTWQIQISGTVDTSFAADVYDVDLFDTTASTISSLHADGRKVICYFSAGSYEDWRPDQSSFQASDKGSAMQGWQGEWWLNTNSANVRSIMTKRIELASSKGCDGIDPDNVDGYSNNNGVGIKESDAVDYLKFLSSNAHSRHMAIGLKNAGGLINAVLPIMEFAVNEQCEQFNECGLSKPFIDAGKPVLHIEYPDSAPNISPDVKKANCGVAAVSGFSTVLKTTDLSAWVDPC